MACTHEVALPLQRETQFSKLGHLRAYGHMCPPWEKARSMAAFVDKVELSLCSEDRFSRPRAPRNALGGALDHSLEHPRTPSGTPHRPHRAEVAPEPVGPRVSSLPIDTFGDTPAHPPPSPYTNPYTTSSSTLPRKHCPTRLAGSADLRAYGHMRRP